MGLRNETGFKLKVSRIRPKIDQLISNWFNGCVLGRLAVCYLARMDCWSIGTQP
ncbi:hypothetical protein T01_2652 [Trichinella spiralis]|uniref:Uncharacterized protein n=1 Tax=Trichinella spiralis TaxID=6334 RepID=A0A0V1ATR0_TRISP|nr:hypothetical protein T01_2652 [Trichinella spiralis]